MKTPENLIKTLVFVLLAVFLMSLFSCQRRYCKAMKPYRNDVKKGYAR